MAFCGVIVFLWLLATTAGILFVVASLYGIFSGALLALTPAAVVHLCPETNRRGARDGMMWATASFGALVGPPIAGALLVRRREAADSGGSLKDGLDFDRALVFTASMFMVSATLMGAAKLLKGAKGR